jgi:excisionase family DNA binding protein
MNTVPQSAWLTATEAASYLRIESRTLLLWARQGKVKGYVLSGTKRVTWRFLRSDLDATLHIASRALNNGRIE